MPDIDFSKYPNVNFRVSGGLANQLTQRGENINSIAKRDLGRYYEVLAAHLPTFSVQEALLLCDALNGVIARPGSLYINIAASEALASGKWNIDRSAFLARLDGLTYVECQAVIDAVERAWYGPGYNVDLRKRVLLVGLAR